jgi:LAS superfamily LD-carboxypeptidase LdcB
MKKRNTAIIIILTILFIIGFNVLYRNSNSIVTLSSRASFLNTTQQIKAKVQKPLEKMIMDAEKDGLCLVVTSGYRTKEKQEKIYNEIEDKTLVAKAGASEHEQGIAVDFGGCPMLNGVRDDNAERLELKKPFAELPEYQWLVDNASKYGFIQSYTQENSLQSGYSAEAWHWKYVK